ncbi:SurA N-terminal domain-containing protein [Geminicoccaceae bacterium 1502E]|nr:SurA N-terminal domain-containing protein [Geminicoccaceae bacterium 1502E]
MLDAMRKQATGWVVKIFLGLLILSFAVWGIGDIFRGGPPSRTVAELAGLEVPAEELQREADNSFRRLQGQLGQGLERNPAIMEGLLRQALEASIARRLIDAQAAGMDLAVDDETVARAIHGQQVFQTGGRFDRSRFEMFLRQAGIGEASYVEQTRGDLMRQRLVDAVTGAVAASESEARELVAWREEQRRGRALVVAAAEMEVEAPDEAALETYLEAHEAAYQAPEYRSVELALLGPADLGEEIEIGAAAVAEAYESRKDAYRTPEQRRAVQLLAADEATIREAARRLAEGQSFAEVAEAMEGVSTSELGPVRQGQLPDVLDKALFALDEGAVGEPLETAFGWHLLRVAAITPEQVRPLAEVRDELAAELKLHEAINRLPDAANAMDDAIAGGGTIEDAAAQAGARFVRLDAVDRTGLDAAGRPVDGVALDEEMLREIFQAGKDQPSLLLQTADDRFYVFNVTRIDAARPRRLEEVREEVAQAWREDRQMGLARDAAADLLEKARQGTSLDELAEAQPAASLRAIEPVTRDASGFDRLLSPAAVQALFATPPGALADEPVEVPDGAAIIATTEIIEAAPDAEIAQTVEALRQQMRGDVLVAWQQALRDRFPVEIDQRALDSVIQSVSQ